jgi:ribosomal protein S12 methylthiotransferase
MKGANGVDIVSLGCSKNLVDSEFLAKQLELSGYKVQFDPKVLSGRIVVVNTCGFIGDAKEESINAILEYVEAKKNGMIDKLFVMGCLSERYADDLALEIPEVDKFYGKFAWKDILADLGQQYQEQYSIERSLSTPAHYAYVKIAEGCNQHCAYCAIPIITGRYKSRPMEEITAEVEWLVSQGVKEFQIIAQDLTSYGKDLYGEYNIAELVEKISDIDGVEWIRLHYAYPTNFPMDLLRVMREKKNVCKYLDIALQHVSTSVLTNMRRHVDKDATYELINLLRKEVPGIHIRTTLMVGFPGEGEKDFEELKDFVKWAKFDRMGAFAYSEEEGTYAAKHFKDDVPDEVKQQRLSELMSLQQEISAEVQNRKVGEVMKVVIDRVEGEYYVGRTEFDSPEVDPEVLIPISDGKLRNGCFYEVEIVDSDDFDLYAKRLKN